MMAVITSAGKTSTVRMQGSISVSASIAQRSLALAGAGIAAMPESMVQADIDAGQLRRLLPGYRLPPIYFYGVYPGTMARRAKTRAFIHAYPVDAQDADLGRRWPQDASEAPLVRERMIHSRPYNSADARILDRFRRLGCACLPWVRTG